MLRTFLGLIGFGGPAYDARILARDANAILKAMGEQYGAETTTKIVAKIRDQIQIVHEKGLNDPRYYGRGITELTELNRAARSRQDNVAWTGITLAIIYIKAEILGPHGDPVRQPIDALIGEWAHALPAAEEDPAGVSDENVSSD